MNRFLILIAGPTAVGKTALALETARYFNTEIISADSRQCYKELNIGVARPSPDELSAIPHHFVASHSIHDAVNAATFEAYAASVTEHLFQNHEIVVMAGGTGLYIRAFLNGLDAIPAVASELREKLMQQYAEKGREWLHHEISTLDLQYAASGDMQNPQRMLRALEVWLTSGKSVLSYREGVVKKMPFQVIRIGVNLPREMLYQRIDQRVLSMMDQGLLQEVQQLESFSQFPALRTVGYQEIFDYLKGDLSLDRAVALIQQHTRQYAKRQLTWFRNQENCKWFLPDQFPEIIQYIRESISGYKANA
jgi:tRNA dimethylallyltransferase